MDIKKLYEIIDQNKDSTTLLHEHECWNELMNDYIKEKVEDYSKVNVKEGVTRLISEENLRVRREACNCKEFGVEIHVGDICYIDFGDNYKYECGYQHFALILSLFDNKAFVVPMTSNSTAYRQAFSPSNPNGKRHLMRFKKVGDMKMDSVLFINDAKFISTARIIDVKGHIPKKGKTFNEIRNRVLAFL